MEATCSFYRKGEAPQRRLNDISHFISPEDLTGVPGNPIMRELLTLSAIPRRYSLNKQYWYVRGRRVEIAMGLIGN